MTAAHASGLGRWTELVASHLLVCPLYGRPVDRYQAVFQMAQALRLRAHARQRAAAGSGDTIELPCLGFIALGLLRALGGRVRSGLAVAAADSEDDARPVALHSAVQAVLLSVLKRVHDAAEDPTPLAAAISDLLATNGRSSRVALALFRAEGRSQRDSGRCAVMQILMRRSVLHWPRSWGAETRCGPTQSTRAGPACGRP